jgi:imidazole glycerol phosphate synthase glutamine amidotransferase subunit
MSEHKSEWTGDREEIRTLVVASTGAANLASVMAGLSRVLQGSSIEARVTDRAGEVAEADFAILPGVGAMGPAIARLKALGMVGAFRDRHASGRPSMGICLGMQLFCEGSEESGGVEGMGIVPASVRRFACSLPLPQLGWNRVRAAAAGSPPSPEASLLRSEDEGLAHRCIRDGWAYFANTYRVEAAPEGFIASESVYGERFVAALESGEPGEAAGRCLLLCQFHPELSGPWGIALFRRWLGLDRLQGGE